MGTTVPSDGGFAVPDQYAAWLLDGSLEQEIIRRDTNAAFSLDGLDQNGDDIGVGNRFHCRYVVIGHAHEAAHQRRKAFLDLAIAGGAEGCQRAPVKALVRRHDMRIWRALLRPVVRHAGDREPHRVLEPPGLARKADADHSAMAVRARRDEGYVFMAQGVACVIAHPRRCRPGSAGTSDVSQPRPVETPKPNISGHRRRDGGNGEIEKN